MAVTERVRYIANPPRRRNARKMSTKQRAIFGTTPAIRAAAKAALRRTRANGLHRKRTRKRANPGGEVIGFTLANPARKARKARKGQKSMAKRKMNTRRVSNRRNPARKHHHKAAAHRRRKNPAVRHHHRRRRNPGMGQFGGYVTNAVFVIVGALGSKLGAQLVLGSNNTGWVGYGMNAVVGAALWFVTNHVMHNKEAASGVVAGTLVEIILRIINDMTPFGSYVSGLGMGDYEMQSFVTPQVLVDPWNSAALSIPAGWGAPAALPAATASMGAPGAPAALAAGGGSGMGSMYGPSYDGFSSY